MNRTWMLLGAAAVVQLAAGCSGTKQARYVNKQADGGVVALTRNTPDNRDKAIELITQHVGMHYIIDKEEDVPNRSVDTKNTQLGQGNIGAYNQSTQYDSEHRITYRRRPDMTGSPLVSPASGTATPGGVMQAGGVIPSVQPGVAPAVGAGTSMSLDCPNCRR